MAIRKNTKRIDPRYFMDEKIELTENQKQKIKTLLEQEIAAGSPINEGMLQDLAKKFGVPIALVAAIASGIGAVNTSADVSPATSPDTTEMPADAEPAPAGFDDSSYDAKTGKWNVSNTMDVDMMSKFSDDSDQDEPFKLHKAPKGR